MEPYTYLIGIVDTYIDVFGGAIRGRGIKTALLIQQASAAGSSISISELARQSTAPLESVRRHMAKNVRSGNLNYVSDPSDERVRAVRTTEQGDLEAQTKQIARNLIARGAPPNVSGPEDFAAPGENTKVPYAQVIAILDAFLQSYSGDLRIRGIKTALLVQQSSESGNGITLSEIARQTVAPIESVRRHIAKYASLGYLRYLADPNDDRVTKVVYVNPEIERQRASAVVELLTKVDWSKLGGAAV